MRQSVRDALRARYNYCCGYCGVEETDVGAELTVDHFQPRSQEGSDDLDNLVYCCNACNQFKGDYWQPENEERILHPIHDALAEHISELRNGRLQGLTTTGRFHIDHLHLNRPALIANRRRKRRDREALAEQQANFQQIQQLTHKIEQLQEQMRRASRQDNGSDEGGM